MHLRKAYRTSLIFQIINIFSHWPIMLILVPFLLFLLFLWLAFTVWHGEQLANYGSIISAGGTILAALWFTVSLWYQSRQVSEQTKQFALQFEHLQKSTKREALATAKSILEAAERKALQQSGNRAISDIEIFGNIFDTQWFVTILESPHLDAVRYALIQWHLREDAALTLLRRIQSAAIIYLDSINVAGIEEYMRPEEFILKYWSQFISQPYFEVLASKLYETCAKLVELQPYRTSVSIADDIVDYNQFPKGEWQKRMIEDRIILFKQQEIPLPAIAKPFDINRN